ncbi:hypothetical protein [Acetivibrio mesophilus]|uniref:Uncharacterized protein n=1 Tax=Acetivibrio mesophilus TaxID=2487273 RepID=A0A4Q0I8H2_9FIRM|nr:hypothetical protein [Acetivibrio mesophilus]ODM26254.1 hypothetical protein A7W90_08455 [Clostridium sp. Bc-iso-3]RXE60693.1 hypothetical protein EFD62_01885 [Acetivibrio mesophilus]HHV28106.1 hypothetical protein [Clostridium sp.]
MSNVKGIRNTTLETLQAMLDDGLISSQDLMRFRVNEIDKTDPEFVRYEMEAWYKTLGIENLIGRNFSLKLPYFTQEEIKELYENDEILLCVPRGITRKELGKLFNLESWALEDELISPTTEIEDFWFKMKKSFAPDFLDKTGTEVKRVMQNEGKLGLSLERYMVFIARMRYLTGTTPDSKYKVWITHGRYESKAMLIAGFDCNNKFSVHGWMPHFHSPLVGGRYVFIPDHI